MVEDVLVKVDKFIFPADFILVDMEIDKNTLIILGRPFLAMGRALIDVEEGNLTLRVQNEKVEFNIFKAIKMFDNERHVCNKIDVIDGCIDEVREECIESNLLDLESVTGAEKEVITALLELSSFEAEAENYENDDDLLVECFMTIILLKTLMIFLCVQRWLKN